LKVNDARLAWAQEYSDCSERTPTNAVRRGLRSE